MVSRLIVLANLEISPVEKQASTARLNLFPGGPREQPVLALSERANCPGRRQ